MGACMVYMHAYSYDGNCKTFCSYTYYQVSYMLASYCGKSLIGDHYLIGAIVHEPLSGTTMFFNQEDVYHLFPTMVQLL